MSKIENRNLIATETFDEFALATEHIDFSVEDLVAYVTSLANVFYWLNVESVWGRLGFVWDHLENNEGYGHFVHTTIPFSVIPSLPDGERITAMRYEFLNSVSASSVTVLKSNWENLEHLSSVAKNAVIDLRGAPLTKMFTNVKHDGWVDHERVYYWNAYLLVEGSKSLYLKADFSSCGVSEPAYFGIGNGTLIVDDDNKYLNMPSHMYDTIVDHSAELDYNYSGAIKWKGEGPFKLDYVWRDVDATSDMIRSYTVSANRNDGSIFYEFYTYAQSNHGHLIDADSNEYIIPTFVRATQDPNVFENCKSFVAKFQFSVPIKVIVDCSFSSIVLLRSIIGENPRQYEYYSHFFTRMVIPNKSDSWLPVEFIGNVSKIDLYNPYIPVEDGIWPEFNAGLAAKVMDNEISALIYNPRFINKIGKCPYTYDVSQRNYVNFTFADGRDYGARLESNLQISQLHENTEPTEYFNPSPAYSNEEWNQKKYYVYNIMPTVVGMHRFEMLKIYIPFQQTSNSSSSSIQIAGLIPSVEANLLQLSGVFVLENTKIKATKAEIIGMYFEKSNAKNICLYTTQDHDRYVFSATMLAFYIKTDIDFIELESYDDSIVNRSSLNLTPSDSYFRPTEGYAYLQPFILTSSTLSASDAGFARRYFNPSYMFVKSGVSISITHDNPNSTMWGMDTAKRIIHSIKKIDGNTAVGTITLKEWLYDALVADDANFESYVMNTLEYTLIKRL